MSKDCLICLEPLNANIQTFCCGTFHKLCINETIKLTDKCPICRFKLDSVEINETISGPSVFGPPRLPRSGRVDHFRRLMEMRQQRDEKEELEAVLLASLETY